ncbi:hypothetical protein AVEN_39465-1 [Araneus ventricosus]|uniref:Uncharacterized protein n=1 Tax=Araneus ventricosus TaxID=182803 RepID=A0A4Y2D971_ARAVE|nr:hypothetical protein AVEN_39465-1 [Araneus ventricosus]
MAGAAHRLARPCRLPHQHVLSPTSDLACGMPAYAAVFSGIGFRAWSPPAPKAETLPLGHRGVFDINLRPHVPTRCEKKFRNILHWLPKIEYFLPV